MCLIAIWARICPIWQSIHSTHYVLRLAITINKFSRCAKRCKCVAPLFSSTRHSLPFLYVRHSHVHKVRQTIAKCLDGTQCFACNYANFITHLLLRHRFLDADKHIRSALYWPLFPHKKNLCLLYDAPRTTCAYARFNDPRLWSGYSGLVFRQLKGT